MIIADGNPAFSVPWELASAGLAVAGTVISLLFRMLIKSHENQMTEKNKEIVRLQEERNTEIARLQDENRTQWQMVERATRAQLIDILGNPQVPPRVISDVKGMISEIDHSNRGQSQ